MAIRKFGAHGELCPTAVASTPSDRLLSGPALPPLIDEKGIGPVIAAVVYTAWSHLGRVRSEAALAALAGVNPIPASSGNTVRHRLNRGGDRRLNRAIHQAIIVRTAHDQHTRAYIERRTAEGKTNRREGLDRGLTDIEDSPLVLGAVPPGVPAGDCVLESLQAARSDGALAGPLPLAVKPGPEDMFRLGFSCPSGWHPSFRAYEVD
jgi:hypothetical protein